ncbi:hypothetical protein [Listeria portnoyi]|uniref:sunset domain-containing protein n=1 Tax=Listeria portnoyi TaxID=2713504 RepID=UPI00164E12FC|nr:hypothetical protein [Listeria portnoyi]
MGTFLSLIGFLGFFYAIVMLILGIFIRGKQLFRRKLNFIILGSSLVLAIIGGSLMPTTQTASEPKPEVKSAEVQAKKQEDAKQALKEKQDKLAVAKVEQQKKEQAQIAKDKAIADQKAQDLKIQQEQQAKLAADQKAAQAAEKEMQAEEAQKAKEKQEQQQQEQQQREKQEAQAKQAAPSTGGNSSGGTQYVDANGQGTIKGSVNHIYHVPGGTYYNRTKNVVAWFKTTAEAEAAGYRASER